MCLRAQFGLTVSDVLQSVSLQQAIGLTDTCSCMGKLWLLVVFRLLCYLGVFFFFLDFLSMMLVCLRESPHTHSDLPGCCKCCANLCFWQLFCAFRVLLGLQFQECHCQHMPHADSIQAFWASSEWCAGVQIVLFCVVFVHLVLIKGAGS